MMTVADGKHYGRGLPSSIWFLVELDFLYYGAIELRTYEDQYGNKFTVHYDPVAKLTELAH